MMAGYATLHSFVDFIGSVIVFLIHKINNRRRATHRREFESVGPTLLENPLSVEWGLLPTLWWAGSWLPT